MTIHNMTPDDEGVYSVIARLEPRGEVRSTAELYLTTKEIKFEMKPLDIPDSRVPIPTMPITAVPPEEIPPTVVLLSLSCYHHLKKRNHQQNVLK
ncbi:titin-like isoform X1 [Saccopteryx leptura]|uniref:titin-like isoform X1 n=1 Tax=Saccopteryx leptura TaxID=249018 RepID=UPI00339C28AD